MLTRRHVLRTVPTAWLAAAAGCGPGSSPTPSDKDTGASEDDPDTADTAPTDTSSPDSGDTGDIGDTGDTGDTETCAPTDDDIEGPFYRSNAPEREDLVPPGAAGTLLLLSGRVRSVVGCSAIPGAVVDVWHADPDGDYDTASPEWRYRGRITTDADGAWQVRTLEPGRYLNGAQYRPAHIHVKIWVDGIERLTTQLYFPGDPYNGVDPWYRPELEVVRTGDGAASFDFVV